MLLFISTHLQFNLIFLLKKLRYPTKKATLRKENLSVTLLVKLLFQTGKSI